MPDLDIPVPGEGIDTMAGEQAAQAHEQNMSQVAAVGVVAQQNFVSLTQLANLSFLQERNMVSLPESLGAREIASKTVPAGPTTVV